MKALAATIAVPLLKIDSVMALRRKSADEIYELVDGSTLLERGLKHVFNLAVDARGPIRDLRFFAPEILAPDKAMTEAEVIAAIFPPDVKQFHSGQVCAALVIRRPTLKALRPQLGGELAAGGCFFPRPALVKFLKGRWLA